MSTESDRTELNALGFRLDGTSGSYRLIRADGSQAALYSPDGQRSLNGALGALHSMTWEQAVRIGTSMARAILADEAQRLTLPRWQPPSLDRPPGDAIRVTSYFPEFNPESVR
jgi:hypothetical protein